MRGRSGSGLAALLALATWGGGALGGDQDRVALELKDGRILEGRLVSETDTVWQLEIESAGGITGRIDVPRAQVKAARRPGDDPAAVERNERLAAARALPAGGQRAQALLRLAEEENLRGNPAAAAEVFLEAGREDPALLDQTDVSAARAFLLAGRAGEAEEAVTRALQRNPKNGQAAAAARELEAAWAARSRELLEPGLQAWTRGDTRSALRLLVRAVDALPPRVLDEASKRLEAEDGLSLAQVMIDCRLRTPCDACDGDGVLDCPLAGTNNASTRCKLGLRTSKLRVERIRGQEVATTDRCERCDGIGSLTCEACDGLGLVLTRPTVYEREAWLRTMQDELTGLEQRAEKLMPKMEAGADRVGQQGGEAAAMATLTELLSVLQRVRAYSRSLSRLDPRLGAIGGGDLRRTGQQAGERMSVLLSTVAGLLYVAGEKRYEDAVTADEERVPVMLRAVRARQAWELVNQARAYTVEALRMNPAAGGLLGGDLRRRQALMERFLKRTWRTYAAMRIAEEQAQKNPELLIAAMRAMGGAAKVAADAADDLTGGSADEERK